MAAPPSPRPVPARRHALFVAAALSLALHALLLLGPRNPGGGAPQVEARLLAVSLHSPETQAHAPLAEATAATTAPDAGSALAASTAAAAPTEDAAPPAPTRQTGVHGREDAVDRGSRAAAAAPAARIAAPSAETALADAAAGGSGTERRVTLTWDIAQWLERFKTYPRAARRSGMEGTAEVWLLLDGDGALRAHRLVASSGHRILDEAALSLVQRASPYPYPDGITTTSLEVVLPVRYRLDRGS